MKNKKYDTVKLNSIPFSDVVEKLDKLKRNGSRMVTICPWHNDTNPSLVLYQSNGENRCHCFACNHGGSVIDYVMQHEGIDFLKACELLSSTFGIDTVSDLSYRPIIYTKKEVKVEPAKEIGYIPMDFLEQHLSADNSFCKCLREFFDSYLVEHISDEYKLGSYAYGQYEDDVMFPSIDVNGRIRNIKLQHYDADPMSPDFCHCDKSHIVWLGKNLIKEGVIPEGVEFDNNCLFGEHLLPLYPSSTVVLVESPKNALFGAAAFPDKLWLATGNKTMLKRSVLNVLSGREVIVYPDRDAISEWKGLMSNFKDIANFTVSDFCDRVAPPDNAKYDIADYLIDLHYKDYPF